MNLNILRRRRGPPLRPLERQLLEALSSALSPEARLLLSKQVEQVNLVQRHANDKEVNLYRLHRGKPSFDEASRFPNTVAEGQLARVSFRVGDVAETFRASFWIVEGYLFSLQFSASPRAIRDASVQVEEVKLLVDPMGPVSAAPRAPLPQSALRGWLREWAAHWQVTGLVEPLPASEREELARTVGAALPADYLDIVAQSEGLQIDGWVVHGLSEVRSVVLPDANYLVLAESAERGVLAVKEGELQARLRFFGHEEEEEDMGSSFRAAVERLVQAK